MHPMHYFRVAGSAREKKNGSWCERELRITLLLMTILGAWMMCQFPAWLVPD